MSDNNELIQTVGEVSHNALEIHNPYIDRDVTEPKQDDAGMGKAVPEDQITKVLVIGQDDALFCRGNRQDGSVGEGVWIVMTHGGRVMTERLKVSHQSIGRPSSRRNLIGPWKPFG